MQPAEQRDSPGYLLNNFLLFGRLLRQVGIRVSAEQVNSLVDSLTHIDLLQRDDLFIASRAFLVNDFEQFELFERTFDLFWSAKFTLLVEFGRGVGKRSLISPDPKHPDTQKDNLDNPPISSISLDQADAAADESEELQVSGVYSPLEILRCKDFAEFTTEEFETAKRLIRNLDWRLDWKRTRRKVRASKRSSYLDFRRAMRDNMVHDGEILQLAWNCRKRKPRPLVVICDISGSMERYSRLFLHFMYALVQENKGIEAFVFGTRLTRLTPALRYKDVDTALDKVSEGVQDWSGGTRIGQSLKSFNYLWSRRVLGRGAALVILSDGWDRGDAALLEREISRLQRSVTKLIWLNPLSGSPDYQPLVRGIRTVLPYVDEFLPFHNLESLERFAHKPPI